MDLLLAPSTPSEEEEEKGEDWRLERRGRGHGKVGKSAQKREKARLIWLLCAVGRRQKGSKGVSAWMIRHKAVGSWERVGEREVGGVQ